MFQNGVRVSAIRISPYGKKKSFTTATSLIMSTTGSPPVQTPVVPQGAGGTSVPTAPPRVAPREGGSNLGTFNVSLSNHYL